MKKQLFLLLACAVISITVSGQLRNGHRVRLEFFNGAVAKGSLLALNDSTVRVRAWTRPRGDTAFAVSAIRTLSFRRRNAPENGFLGGMAAGAATGALIGLATYSPPDCDGAFICFDFGPEYSALGGGIFGGLAGGLLGLMIRSGYTKVSINGSLAPYREFRDSILSDPRLTVKRK